MNLFRIPDPGGKKAPAALPFNKRWTYLIHATGEDVPKQKIVLNKIKKLLVMKDKVEWREVIEKRLLMPTFPDEDIVMFPDDPLGRCGPG
jgi:hypothetical protein